MDGDFWETTQGLPRLSQLTDDGKESDIAIGSRYSQGVDVVNWPMKRVLLSYFASKYVQLITNLPVHDTTAGFVGYKKQVLEKINLDEIEFKGYGFQIEMKYKAWKKNFILQEVPIIFTDRTLGESKISNNIVKEAVLGVIKLRWKFMTGRLWKIYFYSFSSF